MNPEHARTDTDGGPRTGGVRLLGWLLQHHYGRPLVVDLYWYASQGPLTESAQRALRETATPCASLHSACPSGTYQGQSGSTYCLGKHELPEEKPFQASAS